MESQDKTIEKEKEKLKDIIDFKRLEKWIVKNVGKRCKTYAAGCYCCDIWHGYDILRSLLDDDDL